MTNYKQFYNAWRGFTKPKRELLLENVTGERVSVFAELFLFLTTPKKDYDKIEQILEQNKKLDDKERAAKENEILATKDEIYDVPRRGIRMVNQNPGVQDFSGLGSQTTKLVLKKTPQSNVYQVDEHAGRARSFANLYKNKSSLEGSNVKTTVTLVFMDGKTLSDAVSENVSIKAQNQVLDTRLIPINQLISDYSPSGGEEQQDISTQKLKQDKEKAQKTFLNKLEAVKQQIGSGFEFVRKIRNIGGQTFKDSFTADMKLRGFIDQMFSAYKTFRIIKDNLETFDAGFGVKNLNPDALKQLREEFAEEMNKHFEITNDKGKKLIIVQERLSGGTYAFSLKLQSGETSEDDKDNVIFKAK